MKLKNNESGIAHLAAIVAVVVVLAIGAVGWKVWDSKESMASNEESSVTTQPIVKDAEETETKPAEDNVPEGYSSYKNDVFALNYPKGWKVVEKQSAQTLVRFSEKDDGFPAIYIWIADLDNSSCDQTDQPVKEVTVDGASAEQYAVNKGAESTVTCAVKGKNVYHIVYSSNEEAYSKEYAELLRSFKFL